MGGIHVIKQKTTEANYDAFSILNRNCLYHMKQKLEHCCSFFMCSPSCPPPLPACPVGETAFLHSLSQLIGTLEALNSPGDYWHCFSV